MTDRMAALSTLSLRDVPERSAALDDFYDRYGNNPLIVDKWFTLQATIPEPATLDRVKALTGTSGVLVRQSQSRARLDPRISLLANPKEFNRADGAGYDFIVDIGAGARSQESATRGAAVCPRCKSWRVLEPGRRAMAEKALQRVAAAPARSPDVADIVQRALAAG